MFKFLLIVGIIVYLIYKIGGFFFRAGAAAQQIKQQQHKNNPDSYRDDQTQPKTKKSSTYKGGDYIDYEEVK